MMRQAWWASELGYSLGKYCTYAMCAFRGDVMVFPQQGRNGTDCYTTREEFLQDIHLSVSKKNELESSSSSLPLHTTR